MCEREREREGGREKREVGDVTITRLLLAQSVRRVCDVTDIRQSSPPLEINVACFKVSMKIVFQGRS